jgi:UDP-N-acetyl-2-amino-2-deoxyglucuronate dehydrogenase
MIHFAIIGCGHIANKHIEAIMNIEGAKLVALCDTNSIRINEMKESLHVNGFLALADMFENMPEIDVVCICTPSGLHTQHAVAAANAGKHLIIEKPIALTLEDIDVIMDAAAANHIKVAVVHPNRFRPAIQKLKRALDDGLFGKLSHVNATIRLNRNQAYYDQSIWRGTRAMDGGVLMNQAIHSLDLLEWLVGPVVEVKSMIDTRIRQIESEDVAIATLKFTSGALGIVEASTTMYEKNLEESISIFGELGYAVIGGPTANWIKQWNCAGISPEVVSEWIKEVERDPYGIPGHQYIIQDMVSAIAENREPVVTAKDGKSAVKLVLDICNDGLRAVTNK